MGMEVSPVAMQLIDAVEEYIEKSSKKDYRFTSTEQIEIQNLITRLNNQINILVDYEIKKGE